MNISSLNQEDRIAAERIIARRKKEKAEKTRQKKMGGLALAFSVAALAVIWMRGEPVDATGIVLIGLLGAGALFS